MATLVELEAKRQAIKALAVALIPNPIAGEISTTGIHEAIDQYLEALLLMADGGCTGKLFSGQDRQLRSSPGVRDDNKLQLIRTTDAGGPTPVTILDVAHNPYSSDETNRQNPYWFNISATFQDGTQLQGWISAGFVGFLQGDCASLYPVPYSFVDNEAVTRLDSVLPAPSPGSDLVPCIEGNEAGRVDCAAQVYYRWYYTFVARNYRAPTLQDLLSAVYEGEFGSIVNIRSGAIDSNLARQALVNNYLSFCGGGCTGAQIIQWLGAGGVQSWYNLGDPEYIYIPPQGQPINDASIPDMLTSILIDLTLQTQGTAGQWGNYPYGSDVYKGVMDGSIPVLACRLIRQSWGKIVVENGVKPSGWRDYIFVISTGSLGQTDVYEQTKDPKPAWANLVYPSEDQFPNDTTNCCPDNTTGCQ